MITFPRKHTYTTAQWADRFSFPHHTPPASLPLISLTYPASHYPNQPIYRLPALFPGRPVFAPAFAFELNTFLVLRHASTRWSTLPMSCFGWRMYVSRARLARFGRRQMTSMPSTPGL